VARIIKLWRYNDAPPHVRRLYAGEVLPDWVAEIPVELSPVSEELLAGSCAGSVLWCSVPLEETVICFGANTNPTLPRDRLS